MKREPRQKKRSKRRARKPVPTQRGLVRFFLRGVVTLAPVVLTLVIFGLLYQMVDRYVTGPINTAIYWSLEGTGLGWKALDRLRIEPYDKKYLDPNLLPIEKSEELPGAGISASSSVTDAARAEVQEALLKLHEDDALYEVLVELNVTRFEVADGDTFSGRGELLKSFYGY